MMSGDNANPFPLIKQRKIGRPEHSLPQPLRLITPHFCLTLHSPSEKGQHTCITRFKATYIEEHLRTASSAHHVQESYFIDVR